jgi:DUF4097 and DUF4098 domain-containing protein YvlB
MTNGRIERRSIFGGLLLILIGTLFLLHYMLPGMGIGHIFSRYWPVILIVWGLAKLFDHFAAQSRGQTSPPMLSGGEIALIILLFIVGGSLAGAEWIHVRNPDWNMDVGIFDHSVTSTEEIPAQPVKPGAKIAISEDRGSITVRPDATDQLRVIVTKTASAMSDTEAQQRLNNVRVTVTPVADGYQIQAQPGGEGSVRIDLEVHVPKQVTISARTDRGDIRAADFTGPLTASTRNGDVEAHNITGDVSAEMQRGDARITGVNGNVRLTGRGNQVEVGEVTGDATIEGEFYGPIRVRNVTKTTRFTSYRTDLTILQLSGHLEIDSGRLEISDTQGAVTLVTKSKDITMENIGGRIQVQDRHGDVQVRLHQAPHDEINITDDSGEIQLSLPADSGFELFASSRSGDVESEFQSPALKSVSEGETSRLEGKVGTRGPQIRLVTSYGAIHIRKGM